MDRGSDFYHALNYWHALARTLSTQIAIYIGWLIHRTKGGVIDGGSVRGPRFHRDHGR